jgi:hypothetical protein
LHNLGRVKIDDREVIDLIRDAASRDPVKEVREAARKLLDTDQETS